MKTIGATLLILALTRGATADSDLPGDEVRYSLRDGNVLVGCPVEEDEGHVTIRLTTGDEVRVARSTIREQSRTARADACRPEARAADPNDTRLMFGPSGRPLPRGHGYFSDHYVLFPGFAYGLTDNVSIGGGFSIVPFIGLDDQAFYVSPQVGWRFSGTTSVSTGALYANGPDGAAAAVVFGAAAFGPPERSLTVGLGMAAEHEAIVLPRLDGYGTERRWQWHDAPILLVGGSARISRHLALVGESWLFLDNDLLEQPVALAIRFFGERLSADVGVVLVPELLDEGFPIPWLSVSYRFGSPTMR